jgi:N-acetylglutamate synthase-like GNAT family acetyltransferase
MICMEAPEVLPMPPPYEVSLDRYIDPTEIQTLRASVEWGTDEIEVWQTTLETALAVASVRQNQELIGIGFLVGSPRHAVLCDVTVHPKAQKEGVGGNIVDALVGQAEDQQIKYVTLTFNEQSPWLEKFYRKHGFLPINNAMQLR